MKHKLTALFAALLLTFSLLPAQTRASEEPPPAEPPAVSDTEDPGPLARQSGSGQGAQKEKPEDKDGEH